MSEQYAQTCADLAKKFDSRMLLLLIVEKDGKVTLECMTEEEQLRAQLPFILVNCARQIAGATEASGN
jgi:hypothetical protein